MAKSYNHTDFELQLDLIKSAKSLLHSEVEIVYVLDGEVTIIVDDNQVTLGKYDIFIVNPKVFHTTRLNQDGLVCRILISADLFTDGSDHSLPLFDRHFSESKSKHHSELQTLLNELLYHHLLKQKMDFEQISLYYKLADHLQRYYLVSKKDIPSNDEQNLHDRRVRDALLYIHENYAQPLTLTELSDHLHLSSAYLSRYLKKNVGTNFKEYLTKIRINHAVNDLIYTQNSVLHVALDNGFANLNIFGSAFKEIYHLTPSEYRKKMKVEAEQQTPKQAAIEIKVMEELERMHETASAHQDVVILSEEVRLGDSRPMLKPWKNMLNVGAIADVLNSTTQKHIIQLKQELDFTYIRFWGIFPETINIQQEKEARFNFNRIDHAINFLLQNKLKPFLQLGPKPRTIIDRTGERTLYEFGVAEPNDYDDEHWETYLDILMRHFIAHFGVAEVESWIFEMWCPGAWDKPWNNWYSDRKYEAVYRTVKKYSPGTLVGGCEYVRQAHARTLEKSVHYWKMNDIIPDFVSFQLFLDDVQYSGNFSKFETISDADYFCQEARNMRKLLEELKLNDVKLFISLWSITVSNRNLLNDICFKGAWIMKNMLDIAEIVDMAGYWLASDIYGTVFDSTPMLFGGAGIITRDSIYKPAFHAFKFMEKSMDFLVSKHTNYAITKDGRGNYAILFQNMKMINMHSFLQNEKNIQLKDINEIFESSGKLRLRLLLDDIAAGKYYIRKSSVSKEYGSVLDECEKWGQPENLQREDYEYLQKICTPAVNISLKNTDGDTLLLEFDMLPNEFGIVEIYPQY